MKGRGWDNWVLKVQTDFHLGVLPKKICFWKPQKCIFTIFKNTAHQTEGGYPPPCSRYGGFIPVPLCMKPWHMQLTFWYNLSWNGYPQGTEINVHVSGKFLLKFKQARCSSIKPRRFIANYPSVKRNDFAMVMSISCKIIWCPLYYDNPLFIDIDEDTRVQW
jgi:hypothetical protein